MQLVTTGRPHDELLHETDMLRDRVGSYFNSAAAEDIRTANLVPEIRGVDFIETESEVDALLLEARLIKDVQPRFNQELKDDKTFPYLEIRIREDFPRVEFTRKPRPRGTKLYGPFTNAKKLRAAIAVLISPLLAEIEALYPGAEIDLIVG